MPHKLCAPAIDTERKRQNNKPGNENYDGTIMQKKKRNKLEKWIKKIHSTHKYGEKSNKNYRDSFNEKQ